MTFFTISRSFPTTFRKFPEIFLNHFEDQSNVSEDYRRLSIEIRICFDHSPTNLSVVKGKKEKCYRNVISSYVRISHIYCDVLLYKHQWNTKWAFFISSNVKITCYFHTWRDHRRYGYKINRAFSTGVCIINWAALTCEISRR